MIQKILSIKNFGTFVNYTKKDSDWDGSLKRINVIYAGNGRGKTSLSLILRSLNHNDQLLWKKKIEKDAPFPEIKLINQDRKELGYNKNWNTYIDNVEVFDSFYLEDNIYTISYPNKVNSFNIFELPIKDQVLALKKEYLTTEKKIKQLGKRISDIEYYKQTYGINGKANIDPKELSELKKKKRELSSKLKDVDDSLISISNDQRKIYVSKINKYLQLFGTDMQITDLKVVSNRKSEVHKMIYGINIGNHKVDLKDRLSADSNSLKYYLSEGDKNALALSFFLAKFDIIPEPQKYIVVVDDPFTSFDTDRKRTTINQLVKLAQKVDQFFLLTHDLYFKRDFINSCEGETLDLKIVKKNHTSAICLQNTKEEMLTGLTKDILTIQKYIDNPIDEQIHLREVVRCIRPAVEGVFRLKYFNYISDTNWLGDFIKLIRDSNESSPMFRLKNILEDIEDINDYSKIYHHSNPTYLETQISARELKVYCQKTIEVIERI
jgi:wobble nucleotide-excising tRNase